MLMLANEKVFLRIDTLRLYYLLLKKQLLFKNPKPTTVTLLYTNVGLLNLETKFLHLTWLHCINFAIENNESFDPMLAELSNVVDV